MTPPGPTIPLIAQELRALAVSGLAYGQNPYDVDRYRRILTLSAALAALDAGVPRARVEAAYLSSLAQTTPLLAVEAVVVRGEGVLLIRRTDTGLWALPGGMAEVGETPAGGAERELFEETGLRGRATRLLGVLDARFAPNGHGLHLIAPVFLLEAEGDPRPTLEAHEAAFHPWDALPPLHPGHERSLALARAALASGTPFFDAEPARTWDAQESPPGAVPGQPRHWKVRLARLLVRGGGWLFLRTGHR